MTHPEDAAAPRTITDLAAELTRRFQRLYRTLESIGGHYVALLEPRFGSGELGPFTPEDLAQMRDLARAVLDCHPDVGGAGVVFDVDRIAANDQQLQWLVRGDHGYEPYGFVNDQGSPEFYDFMQLPWFAIPKSEKRAAFAGPILDFLGVDEFIITCSTPVIIGNRFAAAATVDLEVRAVERTFHRLARQLSDDVALTNSEGRIICASSPHFLPGDRVTDDPAQRIVPLSTQVRTMDLVVRGH